MLRTVPSDLDADPEAAIELCRAAHARLIARVEQITDEQVRSPSRLPGWTVAHVLTHLARNADGHVRRLEGALRGEDVQRYPGGPAQRDGEIDEGARRCTVDIVADLDAAQRRPARCGGCGRLRCTMSISAWATSRPTGRRTMSHGSCPCCWPRYLTGCTEQTMLATLWRGCRADGRPRPRSSLIRGDMRTDRPHPVAERDHQYGSISGCSPPGPRESLVRAGEALLGELDRNLVAAFGISQPVLSALAVIDGAGAPLTPSQVSDRVLVASATMTATLDLLERRGWIRRVPNPADRRSVLIEITDEGRATADQLLPGIRGLEQSIMSALTPSERERLLDLLAKVLARTADIAAGPPEPLHGQRNRPARLSPGTVPGQSPAPLQPHPVPGLPCAQPGQVRASVVRL